MDDNEIIIKQITLFYSILSGARSDTRDWGKFKELFFNNATLCSFKQFANNSQSSILCIDEYIIRINVFLKENDFYEYSTKIEVKIFGNICIVNNEYEAFADYDRSIFIKKGTNLISMLCDCGKWRIVNMLWQDDKIIW